MIMERIKKLLPQENVHKVIAALTLWQFISVGLMAVGTWSPNVAIVNTILLAAFIVFYRIQYSKTCQCGEYYFY